MTEQVNKAVCPTCGQPAEGYQQYSPGPEGFPPKATDPPLGLSLQPCGHALPSTHVIRYTLNEDQTVETVEVVPA